MLETSGKLYFVFLPCRARGSTILQEHAEPDEPQIAPHAWVQPRRHEDPLDFASTLNIPTPVLAPVNLLSDVHSLLTHPPDTAFVQYALYLCTLSTTHIQALPTLNLYMFNDIYMYIYISTFMYLHNI